MTRSIIRTAVIACAVFLLSAMHAFGGTLTETSRVSATLHSGSSYGIDSFGDPAFAPVTLTGAGQGLSNLTVTNPDNTFVVTDDRGSGSGWSVTAQCSTLQIDAAPAKAFAPNSVTMPRWDVAEVDGSSSPASAMVRTAASPIDSASGVVMLTASAGGGMGRYAVTVPNAGWGLFVTADEAAGSYASTLTLTWATL